jgi:catechol 2,3-dioxygenase
MADKPPLSFNHVGIYVFNLEKMVDFYSRVLGYMVTDRGSTANGIEMVFMSRDPADHHQIVLAAGRAPDAPSQINQISFMTPSLTDLKIFHEALLEEEAVTAIRPMAHGISWSIYFNDPEGNRTEIFVRSPWYLPAPQGLPLDLSKSEEEIYRETEESLKALPGYSTRDEWHDRASVTMRETGVWPG